VINTNLPPIMHHFRDIAFNRSQIAIFRYPSCVESLHHIMGSDISLKTTCFGLHSCHWPFHAVRRKSYRIRWNNAE